MGTNFLKYGQPVNQPNPATLRIRHENGSTVEWRGQIPCGIGVYLGGGISGHVTAPINGKVVD